jgi:hypothetical protein
LFLFHLFPRSERFGSAEQRIQRTVNEHRYVIVHPVGDFEDFRSRHPSLLLRERIQPVQSVLDVILAQ